jgi:hypothetical protein
MSKCKLEKATLKMHSINKFNFQMLATHPILIMNNPNKILLRLKVKTNNMMIFIWKLTSLVEVQEVASKPTNLTADLSPHLNQ